VNIISRSLQNMQNNCLLERLLLCDIAISCICNLVFERFSAQPCEISSDEQPFYFCSLSPESASMICKNRMSDLLSDSRCIVLGWCRLYTQRGNGGSQWTEMGRGSTRQSIVCTGSGPCNSNS